MSKNKLNLPGKEYWRSLEQVAGTPEFNEFLQREFPEGTADLAAQMNRRHFLTLMGASLALAGLTACRRPVEKIVPYVKAPENIIPGIPQYYANTMPFGTSAYGLIVESHEGKPTKIEGNPKHPANLGGTNVFMQAAILGLYDPDRSQSVVQNRTKKTWQDFINFWQGLYPGYEQKQGEGLAFLSESFAAPTCYRLKQNFIIKFPKAKWYSYEPLSDESILTGIREITGETLIPVYNFEKARIILALDADFLGSENESILNTRGFINGRRLESGQKEMNRLYVAEPSYTITGAMADHRQRLARCQIPAFLVALITALQKQGATIPSTNQIQIPEGINFNPKWLDTVAKDLVSNKGRGIVIAGKQQNSLVQAMVFLVNEVLQNNTSTIGYVKPIDTCFAEHAQLKNLVDDIDQNKVETLVVCGGNPVYNSPADLDFKMALARIKNTIHLSLYFDETSQHVHWYVPQTHFLESWSDARSYTGTCSVIQPMIEPLLKGHSDIELVSLLISGKETSGYDLVRETWRDFLKPADFEKNWRQVLHDGYLPDSGFPVVNPKITSGGITSLLAQNPIGNLEPNADNLEIIFQPSYSVYDGRFANNGWLQEFPDNITKLSWDNAAVMSATTAGVLGLKNEDLIVIENQGRELPLPVWIVPGQADFSIALELGYGRTSAGRIGNGVGFDTYNLRTSSAPFCVTGAKIRKTIDTYKLANTQEHGSMEGRPIIREATFEEYRKDPKFAAEMVEHPPLISLWEEHKYDQGYQWGMVIDLNACTGCNACAIACQSENNVPIVGKEQVNNGREMHWIRLDRYFNGDSEDPQMVYQPMACQHCENAPCEQVCPVAATVHDKEGLNVMVYNRCIGTRYCSNNCPYKVRRFNFFNYTKDLPELLKMAQNPDVTVRSRGVMEKCNYCVQRLNRAKYQAKLHDETVRDGDVKTACQQACPTNAISFGNINQSDSRVVKMKKDNRNYELLAELNIKPRTSYLAKIRNPHPDLEIKG